VFETFKYDTEDSGGNVSNPQFRQDIVTSEAGTPSIYEILELSKIRVFNDVAVHKLVKVLKVFPLLFKYVR
jgi:hypothetical protein